MMKTFHVVADILYQGIYEVQASDALAAKAKVENIDYDPIEVQPVSGPMVVEIIEVE